MKGNWSGQLRGSAFNRRTGDTPIRTKSICSRMTCSTPGVIRSTPSADRQQTWSMAFKAARMSSLGGMKRTQPLREMHITDCSHVDCGFCALVCAQRQQRATQSRIEWTEKGRRSVTYLARVKSELRRLLISASGNPWLRNRSS